MMRTAADRAGAGAEQPDDQPLQHEDPPDARGRAAHRLEDRDVAALLHHEQHQRRDDVERRDHDDQADRDRDRHLLEPQRREQRLVHVGPVLRQVVGPERRRNVVGDLLRREHVVDAELDEVGLRPCRARARPRRGERTRSSSRTRADPRLNVPATLNGRGRNAGPNGVIVPSGVNSRTVSPTRHAQLRGEILAEDDRRRRVRGGVQRIEPARHHARSIWVTVRSCSGMMPLTSMNASSPESVVSSAFALDDRRGADHVRNASAAAALPPVAFVMPPAFNT